MPAPAAPSTSLASAALAAEVAKKVREKGLVLWLDSDGQYSGLVDRLGAGDAGFDYPVVGFRGSHLELMLALEGYGNGLYPEHVLVHLPGLNKESVKSTPVYELYKAGTVFEKSLATLVREAAVGVATPEEVETFARDASFSLEAADAWLAGLAEQPRDKLGMLVQSFGAEEVVLGVVTGDRRLAEHLQTGGERLLEVLQKQIGLSAAWRDARLGAAALTPAALSSLVGSWLMAVEFVHDLREPPVTPELGPLTKLGPFATTCRELVRRFRERDPDQYEQMANELQDWLKEERTSHHARALGSIDTFRFEEATMRAATIDALCQGDWQTAATFAADRTTEQCFWVRRLPALQRTWQILRLAAELGRTLAATAHALDRCASLEEATERYAERLAPVDELHRSFEQRAHALIASDLEDYDRLLEVRAAVRGAYRAWANATNRAFFSLCERLGPLPDRSLRQRSVYEQVVQPLLDRGGRVAFVLVDALRFEMARALAKELKTLKYQTDLKPRLAELPTITAVGMNALAPVERNGRLRPVFKNGSLAGFGTQEFAVCDPRQRVRAMSDRSLTAPAEDIELEEFQNLSLTQLRRRLTGKPDLVVVRSRELDTAGEHGLHLGTFDQTLALLKSALSLLSQAGVDRFVVSSDHGFLLQDGSVENVPFGASKRVPERRHALLPEPSGMPGVLEVRLSALEYEVDQDQYLVFRPDTAVWQTKDKVAPFVHGGNSLQERVIPVLVLDRQVTRGKTTSRYEVVARAEPAHLGRQRLKIAVRLQDRANASLAFAAPKHITLALRVQGRPDVALTLLDAGPPAELSDGRLLVPPGRSEALVEFELEGAVDEKVRVEVYHPDAAEDVTPKLVDGFFDVGRNRRLGKARPGESTPPSARAPSAPLDAQPAPAQTWGESIADAGYRRVLEIVAERGTINEAELQQVLGSPRRVRAFSRHFDELARLLPFEVEIVTVSEMKAYVRKD